MIFYIITNIIFALTLTITIFLLTKLPIKFEIRRSKRIITKIEKELSSNFNYFKTNKKLKLEDYIETLIISSGLKLNINIFYILSFAFSIFGGVIGYKIKSPFLILLLTVVMFFIPVFTIYLISAYKGAKSYKNTFKVLHTAEKASQLTNSPLIIYRKTLPYLCDRDKALFNQFLINFDANKPYNSLFDDLEKGLNNRFLKELVIYGKETSNGINYNSAINLILEGYNKTYELMEDRKRSISGMIYLLYALSVAFIMFSIFITNNYMIELESTLIIQLFFKTTLITVILSVVLSSIALINANKN